MPSNNYDPMSALNMETRTGVKNSEVDQWLKKTTALQSAIAGIADGSLNAEDVSLAKYGIYTEKEEEVERLRKEKNKVEMQLRVDKEKADEKAREKTKWWDGAEYMFGPRVGSEDYEEEMKDLSNKKDNARKKRTEEENLKLIDRYSSDYNRWSKYTPDDVVSKEENEAEEKIKEDANNAQFEATNNEWCSSMKDDMDKRAKTREKRDSNAVKNRLKGNQYFGKKNYKKAMELYKEALSDAPYKINILTNIAQCHCKLSEWEDAMEFCNRALHADKKCVKALSRRAVCVVNDAISADGSKLTDKERKLKALADLALACELEPGNVDVKKQREVLVREVEDEDEEGVVNNMVSEEENASVSVSGADKENVNTPSTPTSTSTPPQPASLSTSKAPKAPIISDFAMITQIVDKIENGLLALPLTSLLTRILTSSQTNRIYLRTSNTLSILCARVVKDDIAITSERSLLFKIIAVGVEGQRKSKDLVYSSMALAAAIGTVYNNAGEDKDSLETRSSACELIASCVDGEGGESDVCVKLVNGDIGLVMATSFMLHEFARMDDSSKGVGFTPEPALNLLRDISKNESTQKIIGSAFTFTDSSSVTAPAPATATVIDGFKHPVAAAISAMTSANASAAVREVACCALSNLALIPEMRKSFAVSIALAVEEKEVDNKLTKKKKANGVQALLAVTRAHKTETAAARSIALGVLMNCCIAGTSLLGSSTKPGASSTVDIEASNDPNGIKREIGKFGGLPILVALVTSESVAVSPLQIKQRAAGLLGRCVTSPLCAKVLEDAGAGKSIAESLVFIIHSLGSKKTPSPSSRSSSSSSSSSASAFGNLKFDESPSNDEDESTAKALGDTLSHIVRCLGVFRPSPASVVGYVSALVKLMPEPKVDGSGRITSSSICMPPVPCNKGSAASYAFKDTTLIANALRALITYLDSGSVQSVVAAGGLERLICTLANNSSFENAAVRKNAGAAVARIVKGDEKAMARCRVLRGMEILVELGQSGKV